MSDRSSPIHSSRKPETMKPIEKNCDSNNNVINPNTSEVVRRERPPRACTQKTAARMQASAEAQSAMAEKERKRKKATGKKRLAARLLKEESEEEGEGLMEDLGSPSLSRLLCSKIVTPLVGEPESSQLSRWNIRSMWQLASILNFLNVFRPLLNIDVEFSAEELETALLIPSKILGDIHMPLLKAIPPVARMPLGHGTWVTALCRKLRYWWHWFAEGDLPIVTSHGAEIEAYSALDPGVRVVILKALCDVRVEQEDVRNFIEDSIKRGSQLSLFRKERIGGDSHGISYWYEKDPITGHRLYREIRKLEVKKGKGKNIPPIPHSSYQWEAVATNLDEFENVSEKLFSSENRTEVSVGKKLKNDMLPEIEKIHKRKEKLLKKQHRQALMLDNMINMEGLGAGRSCRDRKPITYTFDDYDRSISEAIEVIKKKQPSPDPFDRRCPLVKPEVSTNGRCAEPSQNSENPSFGALSPKSTNDDEFCDNQETKALDRSHRRRQRPQRYSLKEFVEAISDNDSDDNDDIVGEVVYEDEYLMNRNQRKIPISSEGDEDYDCNEENCKEEEDEYRLSTSEDSDAPCGFKTLQGRTWKEPKSRSVDELQSGLRRSNRATRNRINFKLYEKYESETESMKPGKSNVLGEQRNAKEFSLSSPDFENMEKQDMHDNNQHTEEHPEIVDIEQDDLPNQIK